MTAVSLSQTLAWRSPWLRFIIRRVLRLVAVLAVVVLVTFAMVHLVPGDPARRIAGFQADPAAVAHVRHEYWLDRPILVQLCHYLNQLTHFSLGQSFVTHEPVTSVVGSRLWPTAQLAGLAMLIVVGIGIPFGLFAGILTQRGQRRTEVSFSVVTGFFAALPHYLTATFLAYFFAVLLHWFPVAGSESLKAAVLPAIAVSAYPTAMLARLVRIETVNVLAQDYIRTARSKWLSAWHLYGRHVMPNVMTAALTIAGVLFASLIGGTVIVEQVFARAGLGTSIVQGVLVGDYPVVQGITLFLGVIVVTVNAIVDVLLALLDPRSLVKSA